MQDSFIDADSFKARARELEIGGILNKDELSMVDFLAARSPNISYAGFDELLSMQNMSNDVRELIHQLITKLKMVDYIAGEA